MDAPAVLAWFFSQSAPEDERRAFFGLLDVVERQAGTTVRVDIDAHANLVGHLRALGVGDEGTGGELVVSVRPPAPQLVAYLRRGAEIMSAART